MENDFFFLGATNHGKGICNSKNQIGMVRVQSQPIN